MIVLPETNGKGAHFVATRVTETVRALAIPGSGPQGVMTVSVGCATHVPQQGDARDTSERLIALADEALYAAKRLGRDRVHVATGVSVGDVCEGDGAATDVPRVNLNI